MLDARQRQLVPQAYQQMQPGSGEQYDAWCEELSQAYGFSIRDIRMTVAGFVNQWHKSVSREYVNHAARIADMLGAGLEQSIGWAADVASGAYKEEPIYDQGSPVYVTDAEGNFKLGKDGQKIFRTLRQPDFNSRTRAIDQLLKMHGAYAPEKKIVDLTGHIEHSVSSKSKDEILRELEESDRRIRALVSGGPGIDVTPSSPARACEEVEARRGAESTASAGRPMVLVDGVYQDDGRAGQGTPVQAVPEKAVPSRAK
mgnify:CR=1 FL=1